MKTKIKHIILLLIVLFALAMIFLSCNRQICPAYGDSGNRSSNYSNTKPIR